MEANDNPAPAEESTTSPTGASDVTAGNDDAEPDHIESTSAMNTPDSSRSYGGPMMHYYRNTIIAGVLAFALLISAVVLGAISLQRSNEALAITTSLENNMMKNTNASPEGVVEVEASPPPTPSPTLKPTASPTSAAPTEPHPLNPQWFQTTHADYQMFKAANEENNNGNHDWHLSHYLCGKNNLELCDYDVYCPNGQGSEPHRGGPPTLHNWAELEETQWAPYLTPNPMNDPAPSHWVQIGLVSSPEGTNENDFGKCWKYEDFYAGDGKDIVERFEGKNRIWILCCETATDGSDGGGRKN